MSGYIIYFLYPKNMKFSIWSKILFFKSFYSAIMAAIPCFYMTRALVLQVVLHDWWSAAPRAC